MSDLFTLDIERFIAKAGDKIDLVIRKIALDVFKRVIVKSPVDTGRFKSNWQVAIGSIPDGVLELTADITHDAQGKEHDRGPGGHRSSAAGNAAMSRVTAEALKLKAGDVITLVNNLPYARRLEYGWSKQAPQGMVRITVEEYNAIATNAASETKAE